LGLQGLLQSQAKAKAHAQSLNEISADPAPSTAKERGLYVDLRDEGLFLPSPLEEQEARSTLLGLEGYLVSREEVDLCTSRGLSLPPQRS